MEVILNINDLKYKNLFENLSIYIEKDKITTISGANNCGKTTLLRILTRQVKTENNIVLYGKNINEYKFEDYIRYIRCVIPKEIIFTPLSLHIFSSFSNSGTSAFNTAVPSSFNIFVNNVVFCLKYSSIVL